MKNYIKLIYIFVCMLLFCSHICAEELPTNGYGIYISEDSTNGKFYILDIYDNSSALSNGIEIGYQIIKINKTKINKNYTLHEVLDLVKANNSVNITLKDYFGKTKNYTIVKKEITYPIDKYDDKFNLYWKQIMPTSEPFIDRRINSCNKLLLNKSISIRSRKQIQNMLKELNYQNSKKLEFASYYDMYKEQIKSQDILNKKLEEIVDKLQNEIKEDRAREEQRRLILLQQNMQAQAIQRQNIQNSLYAAQQANYQNQQLNLQRQQILMQNAPKWNANAFMPKTYNINLNHKIQYGGF